MKERIETLRNKLRYHEHLYYALGEPEISDTHFDALMNILKELEAEHPEFHDTDSPTQRPGGGWDGFEEYAARRKGQKET